MRREQCGGRLGHKVPSAPYCSLFVDTVGVSGLVVGQKKVQNGDGIRRAEGTGLYLYHKVLLVAGAFHGGTFRVVQGSFIKAVGVVLHRSAGIFIHWVDDPNGPAGSIDRRL